ncbi:elastin-like protein [Agromyces sp. Root81]|uniref:ABC transporter permease n=1 Tax=Agromyces sp. Root81 TaxID=1736601 RepID=UPI0006F26A73|nr:ABC transporter permease [Agromyces sp. Root81]KRC61137.1 elastin-like protein [Agromyces sp. Root81]
MNSGFRTAVAVEARKAAASRVMASITVLLVIGVAVLALGMLIAAGSSDELLLAKLGPLARLDGWAGLVGIVSQITSAGGLLAFGVALSWLYGREFSDGTVGGLFALPVRRSTIALAKLAVYLVWAIGAAVLLAAAVAILGLAFGYGATDASGAVELLRVPVLAILTALIAVPAAWAATLGRGLLPGIAATVVLLVLAQVMAVFGIGAWVPIVAPALWAIDPATVPIGSLAVVPTVPAVFGAFTALAWSRLQLDR